MAQSIILKRSALQGKVPTTSSLNVGEIAINTYDGKIYLNRSGSSQSIQEIVTTNVINTGSITLTKTGSFGELVVSQDGNFLRDLYVTRDIIGNGSIDILGAVSASIVSASLFIGNGAGLVNITASMRPDDYDFNSDPFAGSIGYIQGSGSLYKVATTNTAVEFKYNDVVRGKFDIANGFSGSIYGIGDTVVFSSSLASLNAFTSSTAGLSSLNAFTASAGIRLTNLETTSASVNSSISNLNSFTASNANTSLNTYTGSNDTTNTAQNNRLTNLETTSASVNISVTNLNSYSASVSNSIQQLSLKTGSYATTGSNSFIADQQITGSLGVSGDITVLGAVNARQFNIGIISSSILYTSGSTKFGDTQDDIMSVTGSVNITGSITMTGNISASANNIYTIGSPSNRFANIYSAATIYGASIRGTALNFGDENGANYMRIFASPGNIAISNQTSPTDNGSRLQILASGSQNALYVSGSSIFTGSLGVSGSVTATSFIGSIASTNGVISGSSQVDITQTTGYTTFSSSLAAGNIFKQTGSAYTTTNNIQITGSLAIAGNITASNINVGAPSANAWGSNLQGSYFNNFTSASNVSEILRFVAGLLSASAPDASPNTRTLGSVTGTLTNSTTGTALTGRIPQSSTNTTITYLASKGFATAGSTIFTGIGTIYNTNTLGYNYTSVAAGTTVATSSADAQLFGVGLLNNGNPTTFNVSSSFTFRYMDNSSKTLTASSASVVNLQQSGAGTTDGITLAKINTVNPAVIPPGYQDGKFASAFTPAIYNGITTLNGASGSGYYHISASIAIASGSSIYSTAIVQNGSELFYAPLTTIATNVPVQTPTIVSASVSYLTAVSRSLSGAPYLSGSTYTISSSVSGAFSPLFLNGTNASITLTGTGMTATSGVNSVVTTTGTITTANVVYASDGVTLRATSTIPFETDTIKVNGLYTFGSANITNVTQTSFTPTTFTLGVNGYNYNGTATTTNSTVNYFTAGAFGQPVASGSMAYFTRTQGSDTATNSGSSNLESFQGEFYRMQLTDALLTFAGLNFTNNVSYYNLTGNDLQVKPGFLVKPGGANGYWLGDPDTSKTYKYYVRRFTTNGGTKTSMTLNFGQTLVNWGSTTTPAIGALILFQSSKNPTFTNARLYDPSDLTSNFVATKTANSNGQNPFGSSFDLYGNTGGSLATTTYTVPLRSADGMTLDATNTSVYVIVRYNGDPTPITSITATFA
jgi:hypothetical protein